MANKQLVSVRLDEDDLKQIDEWVKDSAYYKRSDVVDAAVRLAAWCIRHKHIYNLSSLPLSLAMVLHSIS